MKNCTKRRAHAWARHLRAHASVSLLWFHELYFARENADEAAFFDFERREVLDRILDRELTGKGREFVLFAVASTDRAHSTMPTGIDAPCWQRWCATLGVATPPDVAKVRAAYIDPIIAGKVTSIFFTNGSLDPWSRSSFLDPVELPAGKDLSMMVIADGSHGEDFGTYGTFGLPAAFEAHQRFTELAKRWLAE